jgi:hypothetical protein
MHTVSPQQLTDLRPGDLIDDREAAAILGLEVHTLRNWRALGKGPRFRKIGQRTVRYHRADLLAFIEGEAVA